MWSLVKSALFRQDAEDVHHRAIKLLESLQPNPLKEEAWDGAKHYALSLLTGKGPSHFPVDIAGLKFRNSLGLAAGFDKDGRVLGALDQFGFGFVEIGTVTPRPQPGNPRPRLFRDPSNRALFNCLGFNNDGADVVANRLRLWRDSGVLSADFKIGINLGKNRATPLEEAHKDYAFAAKLARDSADYVVINVSSPNTPGLRDLQNKDQLSPIVDAVVDQLTKWRARPPLFLKISPEMSARELEELIPHVEKRGCDGFILTNTLLGTFKSGNDLLKGGWSGAPLQKHSIECFQRVRMLTHKPIISVGGIMTIEDAVERKKIGAALIQIYSGWIFGGPRLPLKIVTALSKTQF